jgi:peptidoglycan/LPS O-acetylase OafA/YrhL
MLVERIGVIGAGVVFVAAVLAATTLLALVSWWLLESRFIALKDRFTYAARAPRSVSPGN